MRLEPGSSSVLVTGAAGFIGMNLAHKLGKMGVHVVGLDNFNSYYSVELKRARAAHLKTAVAIDVVDGDVCDGALLRQLMSKHKFTHVVHLAAQPGVRYSLKHPLEYVERNGKCFVELLEALAAQEASGRPYLVYASSSSVYGLNEKIPFAESDSTDRPSNLYGSTKKFNELTALAYYNIYKLQSSGCRFFTVYEYGSPQLKLHQTQVHKCVRALITDLIPPTVYSSAPFSPLGCTCTCASRYGPWGRPDMAAYMFADKIEEGKPITVYNHGNMKVSSACFV